MIVDMKCTSQEKFRLFPQRESRLATNQASSTPSARFCLKIAMCVDINLWKLSIDCKSKPRPTKMSTLADELLQDFEDSGSEGGEQHNEGLFAGNEDEGLNGHATSTPSANDGMELDGDEEEVQDDDEMAGMDVVKDEAEDEEETKARVEKMQLGGVNDVRSVAGLMKTLEPVLEVSTPFADFSFISPV